MANMRLLITGITGFVGSHMAEYALSKGAEVFGSARWRSRTENIDHLRGKIQLVECDLRDSASVRRLLMTSTPTHVIHLAAQSFVGSSWHTPGETVSNNTARIGDGRSTYETGVISRINETARRLELREGMSARDAVARLVGLG